MNAAPVPALNPADVDALNALMVMLYEALPPESRELLVDDLMACHPANKNGGAS